MKKKKDEKQPSITETKRVVFRLLKYRPRSENEIATKLRDKNFSPVLIRQTIEYFQKIGVINDQQFALGWIRSRLNKPFGIYRIRQELKHKGIDEDIIAEAMRLAEQDYDEYEAIIGLAQKRLRKYAALDRTKARRRLYEYLARRGFHSGTIIKALNKNF